MGSLFHLHDVVVIVGGTNLQSQICRQLSFQINAASQGFCKGLLRFQITCCCFQISIAETTPLDQSLDGLLENSQIEVLGQSNHLLALFPVMAWEVLFQLFDQFWVLVQRQQPSRELLRRYPVLFCIVGRNLEAFAFSQTTPVRPESLAFEGRELHLLLSHSYLDVTAVMRSRDAVTITQHFDQPVLVNLLSAHGRLGSKRGSGQGLKMGLFFLPGFLRCSSGRFMRLGIRHLLEPSVPLIFQIPPGDRNFFPAEIPV